jgi:penicillin-binding protein 2
LDYETALSIEIAAADLPGISVERGSKRQYLAPTINGLPAPTTTQSLSHVLGYEGKLTKQELDRLYADGYLPSDTLGKSGIESTYESYLRGSYGKKRIEVNAYGREQRELALTPPIPGYHLTLSIDAAIEQKLEEALRHSLEANHRTKGSAIALDPKNGEILALVSLPTYDNNDFSGGITKTKYDQYATNPSHPLFNRAISGTYPSGSTIKPVMAAAALEEGIITPKTSFLSTGGLRVGVWFFPDWLSGGHGATNVFKALANSVNTFFYYVGGGYRQFSGQAPND